MRLGLVDEDEEVQAVTDRSYWEARASKHTLAMADEMLEVVRTLDPDLELKYNKFYIGLAKGGQPNNFVIFRPKKDWLRLEVRLDRSDETQAQLDGSGLDVIGYDSPLQNPSREGRRDEAQGLSGGADDKGVRRGRITTACSRRRCAPPLMLRVRAPMRKELIDDSRCNSGFRCRGRHCRCHPLFD